MKTVYTRKGEKKVLHEDGSMQSEKYRVHDAIDEINHDNARRGKKAQSARQLVGNSRAAKYIRIATGMTKWRKGHYEQVFKKGGK